MQGYSTRGTTRIEESLSELSAQLPVRRRRRMNLNASEGVGDGAGSMESLLNELDFLREELARLKMQQNQQVTTTIDQNKSMIQVIVNTDPLQQMKEFVKAFHGKADEDVYKWLESIVHFFSVARLPGVPEQLYLQYAPAFLRSYAYDWWKENRQKMEDWQIFKLLIIGQFGQINEHLIGQQLDQRKQQYDESVIKYYYDMMELCNKFDSNMSEKQKIYKLTNGLRFSLYQDAIRDVYETTTEFLTKVQQIETVHKLIDHRQIQTRTSGEVYNEPSLDNRNDRQQAGYGQTMNINRTNKPIQCYKCHEYGHISRDCPRNNLIGQSNQKNE